MVNGRDSARRIVGSPSGAWTRCGRAVLAFVYPPACGLCSAPTNTEAERELGVCGTCEAALTVAKDFCGRCGAPGGAYLDAKQGCYYCHDESFAFSRAWSCGDYDGPWRHVVRLAQRDVHGSVARTLARWAMRRHGAALRSCQISHVVYPARHWTDRLVSRYYAPRELARIVAIEGGWRFVPGGVTKIRRTAKQSASTVSERRRNQRGAFQVEGDWTGRRVLLVDDLMTTGATAHAASLAIRRAGADDVVVLALARGLGH